MKYAHASTMPAAKNADLSMLGRARQVKVTKENTVIVDGAGDSQAIKDRVAQIRSQIGVTTSDYDKSMSVAI